MNETANFAFFTLIAALIVFAIIGLNYSSQIATKIALGFYFFCLLLGLAALIRTVLSVSGWLPPEASSVIREIFSYPGWIVLGVGINSSLLLLSNALGYLRWPGNREGARSITNSEYLVKGLCLVASSYFLATEIGKLAHDTEMRHFFVESGYPVWFLYLIIVIETLGSIGLLVTRTVIPAAIGLAIIMCGAIYTHYNNGDPFSDSLEALYLLILLVCIIVIGLLRQDSAGSPSGELEICE